MANRAIPVIKQTNVMANSTKDGTQHVFFHFFPDVKEGERKKNTLTSGSICLYYIKVCTSFFCFSFLIYSNISK